MSDLGEDDDDIRAGEYVLGALTPAEARGVEADALTDPALAAAIDGWQRRLAPLADLVAPVKPPQALWDRLALATGIVPPGQAAPLPRRGAAARVWHSPRAWRGAAAAASAVAAGLAFLLVSAPATAPLTEVAALTPMNTPGATFLMQVGADGSATVVAVGPADVPQGRSLELWAVRDGATVPVSMGLLPATGRGRLVIKLPPGTQLLVSQEPEGGSTTKLPTGPVVYSGKLTGI